MLCLLAPLSLAACATTASRTPPLTPAVKVYPKEVLLAGAAEIEGGQCTTLGNVFMPDYQVMRDQTRAIKEAR